jgi:hypothetical protein
MNWPRSTAIAATAAAVFLFGMSYPRHNWDMIGYVAAAYLQDSLRGDALLARTYADVKADVSTEQFASLSAADEFRRNVFQHSAALQEQLPFYSIRVVYVELMRGLAQLGVPYPKATYLLGALFASLSVVVLGIICLRMQLSLCVLPLVVVATGYLHVATFSTPDSLALFGALLATLACLSGSAWVYFLAASLPALRTEFVIFSALLMLVMFYRGQRLHSSIALAASLAVYFAVTRSQHAYGWLTLINFAVAKTLAFPSATVPSHDLKPYLVMYVNAARQLLSSAHFPIYLIAGYMFAVLRGKVHAHELYSLELLAVPFAFALLHLALYPLYESRQFVLPASLILVWILGAVRDVKMSRLPIGKKAE